MVDAELLELFGCRFSVHFVGNLFEILTYNIVKR